MSYQVLARKWRPKTFQQVVGQKHVLTALANGLSENRLHHAYLFSGTRGVGKTSIARLFAKGLNCIKGVSADPCGECENCKAIENGNFIDLIEIDAASRTKVEDTRELLDNVQYKPVVGKYKVYLIDEVHMLSRHSFNALLKTLEEPPEYVKFLLATTEAQKLPITILSRCLQFSLKALDEKDIADHLEYILQQEKINFELGAIAKLAKAAQGSVRDSLSLTDQAIAMGNGNISLDVVNSMLGLLDEQQPIEILYALHNGNGEHLMQAVQKVAEKAGSWDALLAQTAEQLHQIAMLQLLPNSADDSSPLAFLAQHISPENVQFFYQIIVSGRKELAFAPNLRIGAEMTLLRALAFHPKFLTAQNADNHLQAKQTEQQAKLVEVPVLSANISSQQNSAELANLAGLKALDRLDQLEQIRQQHKKQAQQKATETVSENLSSTSELPVFNLPQTQWKNKANSQNAKSATHKSQQNTNKKEEKTEQLNAEEYQWEWRNPELAKVDQVTRPSEIKQAILKDITPELLQKIEKVMQQQDKWSDLIIRCGTTGLSRQLAGNCCLLQQDEQHLQLGLVSGLSIPNQQAVLKQLTHSLSELLNTPLKLSLQPLPENYQGQTPNQLQAKIYQQLRNQAKQDLQQDKQILLLQKELDAKLDIDSIRPV